VGYLARFGIPGGEARKLGPKTMIGTKPCFISGAKTYCEQTLHLPIDVTALLAYGPTSRSIHCLEYFACRRNCGPYCEKLAG
jgi:hypothetical protein